MYFSSDAKNNKINQKDCKFQSKIRKLIESLTLISRTFTTLLLFQDSFFSNVFCHSRPSVHNNLQTTKSAVFVSLFSNEGKNTENTLTHIQTDIYSHVEGKCGGGNSKTNLKA